MKYITGILATLSIFAMGCSKHNASPKGNESLILGKWTTVKEIYINSYKNGIASPDTSLTTYDSRSYVEFKSNGDFHLVLYETNNADPVLDVTSNYKVSGNNVTITDVDANTGNPDDEELDNIQTLTKSELVLYTKSSPDGNEMDEDWKYFKR